MFKNQLPLTVARKANLQKKF